MPVVEVLGKKFTCDWFAVTRAIISRASVGLVPNGTTFVAVTPVPYAAWSEGSYINGYPGASSTVTDRWVLTSVQIPRELSAFSLPGADGKPVWYPSVSFRFLQRVTGVGWQVRNGYLDLHNGYVSSARIQAFGGKDKSGITPYDMDGMEFVNFSTVDIPVEILWAMNRTAP